MVAPGGQRLLHLRDEGVPSDQETESRVDLATLTLVARCAECQTLCREAAAVE